MTSMFTMQCPVTDALGTRQMITDGGGVITKMTPATLHDTEGNVVPAFTITYDLPWVTSL